MFPPGAAVVVAVSGGPDSMALLHLLVRLAKERELRLHVAHLNHGLRADAQTDAAWVAEQAAALGLPMTSVRRDVAGFARRSKLSLETAARVVRHRFLVQVADAVGAQRIALGHQRNDQAETVIMRLLRGAGTRGLGGIPPVRERLVRPLLPLTRAELLTWLHHEGLSYRLDPSNLDPRHFRNRVRHEVLPVLEALAPGAVLRLADTADRLRADAEWLDAEAQRRLERHVQQTEGWQRLPKVVLLAQPQALRWRMLKLLHAAHSPVPLTFAQVRALDALLAGPPRGLLPTLPGHVQARWDEDGLSLRRLSLPLSVTGANPGSWQLSVPGELVLPAGRLTATLTPVAQVEPRHGNPCVAYGDAATVQAPLTVRRVRAGERMRPFGRLQPVRIRRLLQQAGWPAGQRGQALIVLAQERPLWLVGVKQAADFCVRPETTRVLVLRWHANEQGLVK